MISLCPPAAAQATPGAPTQSGTTTAQKKKQPAQNSQSPAPQNKYLVKIYPVLSFCVTHSIDPSFNKFEPSAATPAGVDHSLCSPDKLLVSSSTTASDIANAIAADSVYELKPVGSDRIAIYKKDHLPDPKNDSHLADIEKAIKELAAPPVQYLEVIHVSKGTAKQASDYINALNADGITATPLDGDSGSSILLKSKAAPGKAVLTDLRNRISDLRWQQQVSPPTQRLFHLNAASAVKSLSGSSDSGAADKAADKPADTSSAKAGDSASSTASPSVSVTVTTGAPTNPNKPAPSTDPKADANAKSTEAKPADAKPAATSTTTTSPQKPAAPADATPKPPTMQTVNDTVVYTNADGSDRGFFEKNRLMAVLDLPRPEVLLNMWSLQASSRSSKVTNQEAEAVRTAVAEHNQHLQDAIDRGWDSLSKRMHYTAQPGFFNTEFYNYITQKFATDWPANHPQEVVASDFEVFAAHRKEWGWCRLGTYCLGFTHAFEPLRPTFTNILLAIIASDDPPRIAQQTIDAMQGPFVRNDSTSLTEYDRCAQTSDSEVDRDALASFCRALDESRK